MKTQLLYKAIFALLLIPSLMLGSNSLDKWGGKHTKEKKVNKEYTVSSDALVKINNSYGNIDVVTWQENRVVIEVTITTNSNDEEKAQRKLDEIDVIFDDSPNMVSAKTVFNKNKSNSWWKWNRNNNVNMKINYVVKMPITNDVDLNNDYGSINLDRLEGRAMISCDYGKITTKELMADNNSIKFDYTHHSYFEYIKSGTIKADYSDYTVAKAKDLEINADYTKSKVEIAEDIDYNCDYGSITLDQINSVTGDGDYLTTRLGSVYKNVDIKSDYGSIKIERMMANAGDVIIESDYAGIKIGYQSGYNFSFDIDLEYASLRDDDGLEILKKRIESSDKYYSGYHGNQNSGNIIRIRSDYGSVSFYKN